MRALIPRAAPMLLAIVVVAPLGCEAPKAPALSSDNAGRAAATHPAEPPPPSKAKPTASEQSKTATAAMREQLNRAPRVPTDPKLLATQLCSAALKTPKSMAARCCKRRPEKVDLTTCVATLSKGFDAKRLTARGTARCFLDLEASLSGCDWVGGALKLPLSCRGVVVGVQSTGESCSSNAECQSGNCDAEKCGPRVPSTQCRSVAGALVQSACATGHHCLDGACVKSCSPPCHSNEQCLAGVCSALKPPGQTCDASDECVGACLEGLCAMRCDGVGR